MNQHYSTRSTINSYYQNIGHARPNTMELPSFQYQNYARSNVMVSHPVSIHMSPYQYYYNADPAFSSVYVSPASSTSRSLPSLPSLKELVSTAATEPINPVPAQYHVSMVPPRPTRVRLPPIQVPNYQQLQQPFTHYEHVPHHQAPISSSSILSTPKAAPLVVVNTPSPSVTPTLGLSSSSASVSTSVAPAGTSHNESQPQLIPRRNSMPCFPVAHVNHHNQQQQHLLLHVTQKTHKCPKRCSSYRKSGSICEICGKDFKRPSALRTHMVVHNNDKPYKCEHIDCQKRFNVKSNMLRHMRKHKEVV
ncbi:C2H2-type zinc finger protein Ecym_8379 [Eremothecium cymbalariae DBVPG|uniref:C2H2-type domain-containing protein n=1 Tax=Eremothecium cymbalariae (strain CBS 270.75 / DBVPG 7215 / KCTC 17166 / NRRL Y-17582) TaxID=931890 RepID=G8JXS5_ERECY|nr:Hypothetical protein Ecym_8379 [Eremothecium cymbalariae DBVPG\